MLGADYRARLLVFRSQLLAEPICDVVVHSEIGFAHWTQPEVIRPATQLAIQASHDLGRVVERLVAVGLFADRLADEALEGRAIDSSEASPQT